MYASPAHIPLIWTGGLRSGSGHMRVALWSHSESDGESDGAQTFILQVQAPLQALNMVFDIESLASFEQGARPPLQAVNTDFMPSGAGTLVTTPASLWRLCVMDSYKNVFQSNRTTHAAANPGGLARVWSSLPHL